MSILCAAETAQTDHAGFQEQLTLLSAAMAPEHAVHARARPEHKENHEYGQHKSDAKSIKQVCEEGPHAQTRR